MTRQPFVSEHSTSPSPLLDGTDRWQMSFGERAAMIGLLSELRPRLAIEIGTAEGGSLRRIAAYSEKVHSFDMVEPDAGIKELPNVEIHTGDSHVLLPETLAQLSEAGLNVDFALVDGDHSAEGVARDMRDLLDSPAVGTTVIVMHDSMNEEVRRGLELVDYDAWRKVRYVELDCVAGYLFRDPLEKELWGGLALVVVDAEDPRPPGASAYQQRFYEHHPLLLSARDALTAPPGDPAELERLRAEHAAVVADLERHRAGLAAIRQSVSWRITTPLRRAKSRLKG